MDLVQITTVRVDGEFTHAQALLLCEIGVKILAFGWRRPIQPGDKEEEYEHNQQGNNNIVSS